MHSSKIFYCSCGEHGSNTWPSHLQSDALPTELSPQRGNEQFHIRVAYIYFRKYQFMVFFMFAPDHEQFFQRFVGFRCLFHSWSSTLIQTCYISMNILSHKKISIWFESWSERIGEQIYIRSHLHLIFTCVIYKLDIR